MEQSEEICEEVLALLDRMDKFPSEFMDDDLYSSRWGWVRGQIQPDNLMSGFTQAERTALIEKLTELTRAKIKDSILRNILLATQELQTTQQTEFWPEKHPLPGGIYHSNRTIIR